MAEVAGKMREERSNGEKGKSAQMQELIDMRTERLLRLKDVLKMIPVSKSTWWTGCASGRFPQPLHFGARVTCWRESDILALMQREA